MASAAPALGRACLLLHLAGLGAGVSLRIRRAEPGPLTAANCTSILGESLTSEEAYLAWDALSRPLLDNMSDPLVPVMIKDCLDPLAGFVNQKHDLTLALSRTHVHEVIIRYLRAHPRDRDVLMGLLPWIAGATNSACPECAAVVAKLGGFECFFAVFKDFPDDADLEMATWVGLSDLSHSVLGAEAIVNQGGPYKGIEFIMQRLRAHPAPHWGETPMHLTVKYEIMQNVNGILRHDDSGDYTGRFLRDGLLGQVLFAMGAEADLRATQNVGCEVLQHLLDRDASVAANLTEGGAIELMGAAIKRFHDDDALPWVGGPCKTLGQCYTVIPLCAKVLVTLGPAHRDRMVAAGLRETVQAVRPEFRRIVEPLAAMLQQ